MERAKLLLGKVLSVSVVLAGAANFSGCNSNADMNMNGRMLGMNGIVFQQGNSPQSHPFQGGSADNDQNLENAKRSCKGDNPNQVCLALKYVVYKDSSGKPVLGPDEVEENLKQINSLWNQCDLNFTVEELVKADPADYGLSVHPAQNYELTSIRKAFQDPSMLLVVTTAPWDRSGSLGNTGANAWTAMPGTAPYGAVLESPVGTYANIIAHELGHYLNLDHANSQAELMNPIIYNSSKTLTSRECSEARAAVSTYWERMLR